MLKDRVDNLDSIDRGICRMSFANWTLNFAGEYIYISKCNIDVINQVRKSLLFDGTNTWIKKQGGLFDVSIGAYDGAEVSELVGHIC